MAGSGQRAADMGDPSAASEPSVWVRACVCAAAGDGRCKAEA
jgi:hypothetical protein